MVQVQKSVYWMVVFVAVVTLTACQKAKMKSVHPVPGQQVAPAAPEYIHQQGGQTPVAQPEFPEHTGGNTEIIIRPNDNVHVGPDPKLPEFQPSPATPIPDDGQEVDENIFSQNSQEGINPNLQTENVVSWMDHDYIDPDLCNCGEKEQPLPEPPNKMVKKDEPLACQVVTVKSPYVDKADSGRMKYRNGFLCKTNIDTLEIDEKSFKVKVIDAQNKPLAEFSVANKTAFAEPVDDKGVSRMEVILDAVKFEKIARNGIKVKMTFLRLNE